MRRLFLPAEAIDLDRMTARIEGQDHVHLVRVLRCRTGEPILLMDGRGGAYLARVAAIAKSATVASVEAAAERPVEPEIHITVGQALGKGDKLEQVIQHGTEAGAGAFIPVRAERSAVDIPAARLADRMTRWRAIAKGAAEQSLRGRIPTVGEPCSLEELLSGCGDSLVLMLHTGPDAAPLYAALSDCRGAPSRAHVLVGPEGGWSVAEVAAADRHGARKVSLGPRVLRTETAALVAISQLLYHYSRPEEISTCVS